MYYLYGSTILQDSVYATVPIMYCSRCMAIKYTAVNEPDQILLRRDLMMSLLHHWVPVHT